MIFEQEAKALHKLSRRVESKGEHVLDVSTDCVSCVFSNSKFPFTLIGKTADIKGYDYDDKRKCPRYNIEFKDDWMHCARLASHNRLTPELNVEQNWNAIEDMVDNDFSPLISRILDHKLSAKIDGRGGTGKTTLIKQLQKGVNKRKLNYEALTPTNVACRLLGSKATAMHKSSASPTIENIKKQISMPFSSTK